MVDDHEVGKTQGHENKTEDDSSMKNNRPLFTHPPTSKRFKVQPIAFASAMLDAVKTSPVYRYELP
jgi:hypothetical protein